MKLICFLLLLQVSVVAHTQDVLVPGKKAVKQKWIREEVSDMGWYSGSDTALREMGRVRTIIQPNQSRLIVTTTVNLKQAKQPWTDSTIAELPGLKPVYHSSYNGQRDMQLQFGSIINGYYTDKIKKTRNNISDTLSTGFFDSNLYPVLIRWLPLKKGYKKEIAIYDYQPAGKKGVLRARITLVEKGIYKSPVSGIHRVWKVTVTDEIGSGNNSSIYYIDRKTRLLWQQEIIAGTRKMWFKRIEE